MKTRPWTDADTIGLLASVSNWQVGDICEPLVDGLRTCVEITKRIDETGKYGHHVFYKGRSADGTVHDVWRSDHPRRPDQEDISAFLEAKTW